MSHSISIRRGVDGSALAAGALGRRWDAGWSAGAAAPPAGEYSGTTVPAEAQSRRSRPRAAAGRLGQLQGLLSTGASPNGTVRKLLKVGAQHQSCACASGEVKEDRYLAYIILGGKIDRLGRFSYAYRGFTIKGPLHLEDDAKEAPSAGPSATARPRTSAGPPSAAAAASPSRPSGRDEHRAMQLRVARHTERLNRRAPSGAGHVRAPRTARAPLRNRACV